MQQTQLELLFHHWTLHRHNYTVFITAYVPCSGLSQNNYALANGCGYSAYIEYPPSCDVPTPPLHGWISDYHSIALHSAVTFQCDFGWSKSNPIIGTT